MTITTLRRHRGVVITAAISTALSLAVAGCETNPDGGDNDQLLPGELIGYWVVRMPEGGGDLYGLGRAVTTSSDSVQWEFQLADQRTATLSGMATGGAALTGDWRLDGASPTAVRVGRLEPVTGTLAVTTYVGDPLLVLHPVTPFVQSDVGVYSRAGDSATVIFAHDLGLAGTSGCFSVLDMDGYWPEDYRYRGFIWEGEEPLLADNGVTAARFDDGARIYTCLYDWNTDEDICDVLSRLPDSAEHTELGGVWMGKGKRYDNLPEWFYAVVVEHEGALYVHERDETLLDSLFLPELRAVYDAVTGEYVDTDRGTSVATDWRARPTPDGAWLIGEYDDGDPATREFHSLQRIVRPPEGYLTGDGSTLSVDWFDAPGGYPQPVLGNATITQEGSQLTVVDQNSDGATYQIDAVWTGYQYEGYWFDVTAPELTSPWRGQLPSDGWYLHGTWEKGEYSVSILPMLHPSEVAYNADEVVVSTDLYHDDYFYTVSPIDGAVLAVKRSQATITSLSAITPADGQIDIELDERLRPTRITMADQMITIGWRSDSTAGDVTVEDVNGTTTTSVTLDLSAANMLSMVSSIEGTYGVDLTEMRDWINEHPDLPEQVYYGQAPAPSARIYDPSLTSFLKANPDWNTPDVGNRFAVASGIGGFLWALGYLTGIAAISGVGAALIVAAGAVWLLANLLTWLSGQVCDPCGLACFIGCL